jgi:cell division protein FtsW (lipid II flippase)
LLGSISTRTLLGSEQAIELAQTNGRRELFLLVLAAVFVFTNGVALNLALDGRFYWFRLAAPAAWLGLVGGAYVLLRIFRPFHDPYLLPIVGLLTGWGFVLLGRLAPNFLGRQVLWLAIGIPVMVVIAIFPRNLRFLRRYRYTWLILGIILLGATLFLGVNPSGGGAALWLQIPFLGRVFFQPSELLKLLLIVFLASYFEDRETLLALNRGSGRFGPLPYLAPLLLMWGFCVILLVWQRDLGAATLFFIVFLSLLYVAAGDKRYLFGGLVLLVIAGVLGYFAFDVVALRVDTWLNPWPEADTRGYQIVQSLYAIASGGIFGQGVAQGYPNYIPVVHSDFAFAAVAEEWGLIGALGLVGCFALLAYRGLWIAIYSERPFRLYLAAGVTITLTAQSLLIMGGVTKLLPLTGVTLPFVSYGGSSLLMSCIMVGLLLYLSDDRGN